MLEAKRFDNSVTGLGGYANFFAVIALDLGHVVIQVASRRESLLQRVVLVRPASYFFDGVLLSIVRHFALDRLG